MSINRLLLGSAAALFPISGALANGAKPEPAQQVRICDVYGAGYFYIPGTETCLRVGGYVRFSVAGGAVGSFDGARTQDVLTGRQQDTWQTNSRLALKTWTGQETELGTLKTYTETRFEFGNAYGRAAANTLKLKYAWIQLGGLRVGKDDSAFNTFIGYAGNVINDTLVPYGGPDTNLISYTFDAGNGFSAVVSLEQGSGSLDTYIKDETGAWTPGVVENTIDSYAPNVVVGARYTQGWGGVSAVVAYNSPWQEWAGIVRLDANASDELSLFAMAGFGTSNHAARSFYKAWGGSWAVWTGGAYKLGDKTTLNAQLSYDEQKNLGVAVNVAHEVVPGLTVTAELDYLNEGKRNEPDFLGSWTNADRKGSLGGILQIQRDF